MAKSLKGGLAEAMDLVAMFELTRESTLSITVSGYSVSFHVDLPTLVRVSREANVPQSDFDIFSTDGYVHVRLKARGAEFVHCARQADAGGIRAAFQEEPAVATPDELLLAYSPT